MTESTITLIGGALLSLGFSYVPGFNQWFQSLSGVYKRLVLAAALLLVAVGSVALSCAGLFDTGAVCSEQGIMDVVSALILAFVASQAMYTATPAK